MYPDMHTGWLSSTMTFLEDQVRVQAVAAENIYDEKYDV